MKKTRANVEGEKERSEVKKVNFGTKLNHFVSGLKDLHRI